MIPTELRPPKVALRGIVQRFGALVAVDGADLELHRGEVHALLGENGAGKTTLMCVLAGLHRPQAGTIAIDGQVRRFRSPREAMAAGIGMVHQHFMLVPTLTVWENVELGAARLPFALRPRQMAERVQRVADELGLTVSARARVGELSTGEQQRVEILRVLARGADVLILDEPTAVLAPEEAEALFASLRALAAKGTTVVLISHKFRELRRVADRITILRRGRVVAHMDSPAARSDAELVEAMVGRAVSLEVPPPVRAPGEVVLAVRDLDVPREGGGLAVRGATVEVRAGEIVGVAGISGNGQGELFEAIAGTRPSARGTVAIGGADVTRSGPRARSLAGLRYVPEDRSTTGTSPSLSVAENLALRRYHVAPCRRGPWLDLAPARPFAEAAIARYQIATTGPAQQARLLSGGNLQKLVVAREIDGPPRLLLAMQPTRGLDAWATAEVRRALMSAREAGAAVLLVSEDLDEVLALSDRVAVLVRGRLGEAKPKADADKAAIGRAMTGQEGA